MIISGQYTAQVGMGDNQRTIHGMMDMDMDMDMDMVPDNQGLKQMLCGHVHGHLSAWHAWEPASQAYIHIPTWGCTWGCTSVGTARGEGHLGLHSIKCVPY